MISDGPNKSEVEEELNSLIHLAGLRATPVRRGVMQVLRDAGHPITANEILGKLPPHAGVVTVYRTLEAFVTKELIHRIRGDDREWRFAAGSHPKHTEHQHPHFVCENCGRVECLKDVLIPPLILDAFTKNKRYRIAYAEVLLHGKCGRCQ